MLAIHAAPEPLVSKEVNLGSTNRLALRANVGCAFDSLKPLRVAYMAPSYQFPQPLLDHWHKARQCLLCILLRMPPNALRFPPCSSPYIAMVHGFSVSRRRSFQQNASFMRIRVTSTEALPPTALPPRRAAPTGRSTSTHPLARRQPRRAGVGQFPGRLDGVLVGAVMG